jgi:hypothetical protein
LEALRTIQAVEPTRPRQVIAKFNSEMEAILLTALDKEREKRYQSAADLKSDIENWLEGRPIRVKSISTMYLLRKIIARHRYTSTVVGLLALIVLGFAYISFELLIRSEKSLDESQALAKDYAAQAKSSAYQIRQASPLFFARFLQAWRDDRTRDAEAMARYFADDPKKWKAAVFLLRDAVGREEEERLRGAFSEDQAWFADFIIAERYFKDGDKRTAFESYQRAYQGIEHLQSGKQSELDKMIIEYIKARVYELGGQNKSARGRSAAEDGGQEQ